MPLKIRPFCCLAMVVALAGCQESNVRNRDEGLTTSEASLVSEYTEEAKQAVEDATATYQLFQTAGGASRVTMLRVHLARGLQASELAIEAAHNDREIVRQNAQAKASLLLLGTRYSPQDFAPQLQQFAEAAWAEDPAGAQAEFAQWAWIIWRHVENESATEEKIAACNRFADAQPESPLAVELYLACAERLDKRDDLEMVYAAASEHCSDSESVEGIRAQIKAIEAMSAKAAVLAKFRERYVAMFTGGPTEGYFVVYAESNKTRSSMAGMRFRPVDYTVLHGGERVTKYIQERRASGWMAEVVATFADDRSGRRQAEEQCQRLLKEKTKMFSVWN